MTSIMIGSTETILYTMSVYFSAAKGHEDPLYASGGSYCEYCRDWREYFSGAMMAGG